METSATDTSLRPSQTSPWTRAATPAAVVLLATAVSFLLLAYVRVLLPRGPVLTPWLGYLEPSVVPLARLLTGALWLAALVEVAGGDHAWLRARHTALRALFTAGLAGAMFYALRDTRCELGDGPALVRDPVGAVTSGGYYTFLEELAGMWLPLRLARARFVAGVPAVSAIVDGYRIVSIGFGMLYAAAVTCAAQRSDAPRRFALLMFGHAALLQFMGYVENYVGAFTLLALGFLPAATSLREGTLPQRRLLQTTFLFALAALFHGVAVWSAFGLVALALCTERGPKPAAGLATILATNVTLGLGTLALGVVLFRAYLTPGVTTVHVTPLLEGGATLPFATSLDELVRVRPPREHGLAILRVAFPSLAAIGAAALAAPRALGVLLRARDVRFSLAYLLGFLIHQLLWRSTLGTYRDWDLFGFTALPFAYLGARAGALLPRMPLIYALLLTCCTLGGLSWPLAQTGTALSARDRAPVPWDR